MFCFDMKRIQLKLFAECFRDMYIGLYLNLIIQNFLHFM